MIRGVTLDKDILYSERGMAEYKKEVDKFDLIQPSCRLYDIIGMKEIVELLRICKDSYLQCRILKKIEAMKRVLEPLGFIRYINGTNRICFKHVNHPDIILKVALDEVGLSDSLSEYRVQEIFKPYVCKIFEVDPSGVVALVETVQPIRRHEQLALVADEMFDVLNRFFGASKYLMEDIGEQYFLNWGIRKGFGLVLLDYPYLFKLDKNRAFCTKRDLETGEICGGEIDYDDGFNHLYCKKCGKEYKVKDIAIKLDTAHLERRTSVPMYDNDFTDEFAPSIVYLTDNSGKVVYSGNLDKFNIKPEDIESGKVVITNNGIKREVEDEEPKDEPKIMSKRHMAMTILKDMEEHGVEIPEKYLNKIRALYNIPLKEDKEEENKVIEAKPEKPKRTLFTRVTKEEKEMIAKKEEETPKLSGVELQDEPIEIDADIVENKEEIKKASEDVSDMFSTYSNEEDGDAKQDDVSDIIETDTSEIRLADSLGLPKKQKVKGIPEKYMVTEEDKSIYQQMSGEEFIETLFTTFDEMKVDFINTFAPGNLEKNINTLFEDILVQMDITLGQYMVSNDIDFDGEEEVKEKARKLVKEYFNSHKVLFQFKSLDKEVNDAELKDKYLSSNKKKSRKFRK